MQKKFFKIAFITSPIIAIYGVSPVFLLDKISNLQIITAFLSSTILIFLFWGLNIFITNQKVTQIGKYFLSYVTTFLLHFGIVLLVPKFPNQPNPIDFLLYSLISSLAVNTIILAIIHAELLKQKKNLAESEVQKLKVGNLEAQKQVLLQQLQPHFLFNALSTLKSLIRENPMNAEDYVIKLSEFLRYSIEAHTNELVTLQQELQFTQDYLELQKVRFGDAFHCEINIPNASMLQRIPVFALQTLVENAIKHNAFTDKKPLLINISVEGNQLKICNNKIPKQLILTSGIGLKNLNERYKIVTETAIVIKDEPQQFTVFITLLPK
jgi:two-component system LytT family sensor kinase